MRRLISTLIATGAVSFLLIGVAASRATADTPDPIPSWPADSPALPAQPVPEPEPQMPVGEPDAPAPYVPSSGVPPTLTVPPTVSAEAFAEIQRQSELAFAQLTAEWEARTAAERAAARRGGSGTAGSTGMTDAETLAAPTADAALSPALAPRQPWTGTTQSSPVLAPHPAQPRACALSISFTVHDRFC